MASLYKIVNTFLWQKIPNKIEAFSKPELLPSNAVIFVFNVWRLKLCFRLQNAKWIRTQKKDLSGGFWVMECDDHVAFTFHP